jgi:hypothetical protein
MRDLQDSRSASECEANSQNLAVLSHPNKPGNFLMHACTISSHVSADACVLFHSPDRTKHPNRSFAFMHTQHAVSAGNASALASIASIEAEVPNVTVTDFSSELVKR